jgi:hypothetical protein
MITPMMTAATIPTKTAPNGLFSGLGYAKVVSGAKI